jgi:hypothetical protein
MMTAVLANNGETNDRMTGSSNGLITRGQRRIRSCVAADIPEVRM